MLEFSKKEYQSRVQKVKEKMEERGIEVLLITDPANMNYLTGYNAWSFYVHQMVMVALDEEEPIWIGRFMDAIAARKTAWLDHDNIIAYGDEYVQSYERHPMDFIADFVKEKGKGNKNIAVEMDNYYFTAQCYLSLKKGLPNAKFEDARELVNWVRIIKSDMEIKYMKRAGKIMEKGMSDAIDYLEAGVRKNDMAAEIYRTFTEGTKEFGGDYTSIVPHKDRNLFKINKRGLCYAAIIGLICHALYNLFMFKAVELTTISTTVTLLYTSPIFVAIMSRILFKENITFRKLIALIFAVIGSWLTVTGGSFKSLNFNIVGVLYALGAGFFYATMTIINKFVVDDFNELTLLTYTLGFAFVFSLTFSNPLAVLSINYNLLVYVFIIMLGILSTAISYLIYLKGLSYGVESSKASIIATFEVPVSIVGSMIIFSQKLSIGEILGVFLVMISIFLINERNVNPSA